jgi:hypothetical protein
MMHLPTSLLPKFQPLMRQARATLNPQDIPVDVLTPAEAEDDTFTSRKARLHPATVSAATLAFHGQDSFGSQSGVKAALASAVNAFCIQGKSELPHVLLDATDEERHKHNRESHQPLP